jgi:hypothetical protein
VCGCVLRHGVRRKAAGSAGSAAQWVLGARGSVGAPTAALGHRSVGWAEAALVRIQVGSVSSGSTTGRRIRTLQRYNVQCNMAHGMQRHPRQALDRSGRPLRRTDSARFTYFVAVCTTNSIAAVAHRSACGRQACISHTRTALCPRQQRPVCRGAMVAVTLSGATERRCSKCDAVRCGAGGARPVHTMCTRRRPVGSEYGLGARRVRRDHP